MSLKIGNETVTRLKLKGNHSALVMTNEETQDKRIVSIKGVYPRTNTAIETMFSNNGLTIKTFNLKAMGSYSSLSVRIFNSDTNKILIISNNELLKNNYALNEKLPFYIKGVLAKLVLKMEAINRSSVKSQYKLERQVISKKAIELPSIICPMSKTFTPIFNCFLCSNMLASNRNQIVIKYHTYIRENKIKVLNEVNTYLRFLATLTEKEKDQLKTVNCRLNID